MFARLFSAGLPVLFVLVTTQATFAGSPSVPFDDTSGCMEGPMEQFGRYLGDWDIADSSLGDDGTTWSAGAGARWTFACLGNGTAIQDFWMPNGGGVGTNLRTYNNKTQSWDIAWTMKGMPIGFAHIQARQSDNGDIVMTYKSPIPTPARRITFFPPGENSWKWKLEQTFDAGTSWTEVYRISATRKSDPE
jgi:hypothetical protein